MLSFLPRLGNKVVRKIPKIFKIVKDKEPQNGNLLFLENIKEYTGNAYIKQICDLYFKENKYNPTKYQLDLSDEIVYNSDIVSRKYKFFKVAVYLDIFAFLLLAVSVILA